MDRSDIPLAHGTVGGAIAFVLGYLLTYLWQGPGVRETLADINAIIELVGGQTIPVWKAVAWIFYNAHAVPLRFPSLGPGSGSRSLIGGGGAPTLLYVLPPLVLLLVGAGVAWWAGSRDLTEGAIAGGSMVVGYLLLAVIGVFVFRYTIQDAFIGPQLVMSALIAGIVYPVVFGAIGGGLAGELR